MSLRKYFKPVETLPSHKGLPSSVIRPEVLKKANEAVQSLAKPSPREGVIKSSHQNSKPLSLTLQCYMGMQQLFVNTPKR